MHVGRGRVDAAVTTAPHREVEHIRRQAVGREVADGRATRQLVGLQERSVTHARGCAHALRNELVKRGSRGPLGDQREDDIATVAVREPFTGRELLREPVERGEVLLGGPQLVHRDPRYVILDLVAGVFVEIVADPGPMREQLLDGYLVVDEREIASE